MVMTGRIGAYNQYPVSLNIAAEGDQTKSNAVYRSSISLNCLSAFSGSQTNQSGHFILIQIESLEHSYVRSNQLETKSLNSPGNLLLYTIWSIVRSSMCFIEGEDRGC